MLAFAVVVVGGVMIAEPLRAVAHFSRCPHGGGVSVKSKKTRKSSLEQRRNTSNAGRPPGITLHAFGVGRIASLLIFPSDAISRTLTTS
jgi:hypothetical protein